MRELSILREIQRRQGRESVGGQPQAPRLFAPQAAAQFHAGDILRLPENVDGLETIQKTDGSFYFMVGFSAVDGPDTVQ